MAYDPKKHNRRSIRLPGYDYSSPGAYFVTLNVQGRLHLFGEVVGGRMELSAAGRIAQTWWQKLPARYERTALDAYVVMPDHLHGLLCLTDDDSTDRDDAVRASGDISDSSSQSRDDAVRAIHESPRQHHRQPQQQNRRHQQHDVTERRRMLLPKIIGYYKMNTAKRINQMRGAAKQVLLGCTPGNTVWQRNYYEHIVRSPSALHRIRRYIEENPAAWEP